MDYDKTWSKHFYFFTYFLSGSVIYYFIIINLHLANIWLL